MLVFLKKKINNKNCIILDQVNFTKKKYLQNKREIISKIIKKYLTFTSERAHPLHTEQLVKLLKLKR